MRPEHAELRSRLGEKGFQVKPWKGHTRVHVPVGGPGHDQLWDAVNSHFRGNREKFTIEMVASHYYDVIIHDLDAKERRMRLIADIRESLDNLESAESDDSIEHDKFDPTYDISRVDLEQKDDSELRQLVELDNDVGRMAVDILRSRGGRLPEE